jgi:hypothetical protein
MAVLSDFGCRAAGGLQLQLSPFDRGCGESSHCRPQTIWGFCLQSLESDIHGSRECRFPELLTSAALLRVACREQSVEKRDAVLMSISNGR